MFVRMRSALVLLDAVQDEVRDIDNRDGANAHTNNSNPVRKVERCNSKESLSARRVNQNNLKQH